MHEVAVVLLRSAPGWIEIPTSDATSLFQFQDATMTIFPDGSWRCVAPNRFGGIVAEGKLALLEKFIHAFATANPL
jgi:hypothetical protein